MARPKKAPGSPPDQHRDKATYNPEILAEKLAASALQGRGGIQRSTLLKNVTEDDKRTLSRIVGEPVEAFNERFAQKLRIVSDKALDRIEQHLDADSFKTGELAFVMTSATDKRLALDGSRALHNASVNLTVNQFGPLSKPILLGELDGLGSVRVVSPALAVRMDSSPTIDIMSEPEMAKQA